MGERLTQAVSARMDDHSRYGTQFSPLPSLLYRPGHFTVRASVGRGFHTSTPFVEAIEATGFGRLEPLCDLWPEVARSANDAEAHWRLRRHVGRTRRRADRL